MAHRHPNFLCFVTDQQRADHLGCAGNPVIRTPNMDRIARGGVRFQRAYCNNPLCMPSRATLFTGRTPRGHRVRTNGIPLEPGLPTIGEALIKAGYRTHGIGKIHLRTFGFPRVLGLDGADPQQFCESAEMWRTGAVTALPSPYYGLRKVEFCGGHGTNYWGDYRRWIDQVAPGAMALADPKHARAPVTGADQSWKSSLPDKLHPSQWIADRAIEFLGGHDPARPFFLWVSFPDPHHPYCPPAPYDEMYRPDEVPMPARREGELERLPPHFKRIAGEPMLVSGRRNPTRMPDADLREIIAHTYGMISCVDAHLGRVLDALEASPFARDTVVVFLCDHGDLMGDHWLINKGPFHFEGMVRAPFLWRWPGVFAQNLETPALASLLDFAPTILDLAAVPIPEGPAPAEPEAPQNLPPWPGVSLAPLLRGETDRLHESLVIENDEDYLGLRLRTLVTERHKLTIYAGQPYGELFDLREDPNEFVNLWDDPAARSLRADLTAELAHQLALSDDRLPRRLSHA